MGQFIEGGVSQSLWVRVCVCVCVCVQGGGREGVEMFAKTLTIHISLPCLPDINKLVHS